MQSSQMLKDITIRSILLLALLPYRYCAIAASYTSWACTASPCSTHRSFALPPPPPHTRDESPNPSRAPARSHAPEEAAGACLRVRAPRETSERRAFGASGASTSRESQRTRTRAFTDANRARLAPRTSHLTPHTICWIANFFFLSINKKTNLSYRSPVRAIHQRAQAPTPDRL